MLAAGLIESLARRLDAAESGRAQIRQFSLEHPDITVDDAYAIQKAWVAIKLARGRTVRGHKIGLTSRAMQRSSNIDEPDYGVLLDDMFYADGDDIPHAPFILPRVEMELAFILRAPLSGPACALADVLTATEHVVPAVEIIDARIHQVDPETRRPRRVMDTIADNAANAAIVLSHGRFAASELDLPWVAAVLRRGGVIEESGVAAAVLDNPANGVAWLANKLHPHGETLHAGEVILAGSFIAPVAARQGDAFEADYGPLGAIRFRFV
jgi:2-oxo-hept-3-ene-1,7-dioate hydratase